MKQISINIGKKKSYSNPPCVGVLKTFLEFKNNFDGEQGLTENSVKLLSELIKKVFPTIKDRDIEKMKVSDFIGTANMISDWLALALSDAEKKL